MRLKKNLSLHKSPAMWSACASGVCTGLSQYLDVFTPVVPETPAWRTGLFTVGILFAILAAIAPGIFDTSDNHS